MTEDQAWRELQEQLKSEPELMEDFVSLVLHVLDLKQRTVLALRRLGRGWFYCACSADEAAMKYLPFRNTP